MQASRSVVESSVTSAHHTTVLRKSIVFIASVAVITSVACRSTTETNVPAARGGVDVEAMDRSVKPGDDFYKYANGTWIARTEIPGDRANWGTGAIVAERTNARVADLIKNAAAKAPVGSDAGKVGDFYTTYMDEAAIDAKGLAPLQPTLDRIAAIRDTRGLARALGGAVRTDVDALNNTNFETPNIFGLWVAQDLTNPTKYSAFLLQGGLGMPNREYYLDPSPRMAGYREKYETYVATLLELARQPDAAAKAARVSALEQQIAKAHGTREDSADVLKSNNRWARADFDRHAPGMDWTAFFDAAGLGAQHEFVVWQPTAPVGVAAAIKTVSLSTWKDYLVVRALDGAAPMLPKAFVDAHFDFHSHTLAGTPVLRDRWKRAVDATNEALGNAVGRMYVETYFPPAEKERAAALVRRLIAAFDRRLDGLEWMNAATRQKAKAKLAVLQIGVGYPDTWLDYSGLSIVSGDAVGNAERASLLAYRRHLAKLGMPVDRGEWVSDPQVVNAFNLPAMNAMNFPAAILQPPYFDRDRPEVMDYGAIGAVIGHEISHSFDDQGALFDAAGTLSNWWTKEDFDHFKQQSARLIEQYNAYRPFPDLAVNGKLTLSENIADVAGLAVAYEGYRLSLGGREAPSSNGLSGDQQFFLSFAQMWRAKFREAALRRRVLTDGHAPPEYRSDTVRNLSPWYAAFSPQPGERLYLAPPDRVSVW
jgi:putative endopeptidase